MFENNFTCYVCIVKLDLVQLKVKWCWNRLFQQQQKKEPQRLETAKRLNSKYTHYVPEKNL